MLLIRVEPTDIEQELALVNGGGIIMLGEAQISIFKGLYLTRMLTVRIMDSGTRSICTLSCLSL
jgi:hypothetical protein